jgi:hypothetical protein
LQQTATDTRTEQEALKMVAASMEDAVVLLRAASPHSTWIGCLSLARVHLLREVGRGHLELAGTPAGPE